MTYTLCSDLQSGGDDSVITVGVLALQGAFIEHIRHLERVNLPNHAKVNAIPVRSVQELEKCEALVIPGGESTVILSVAARTEGMLDALKAFIQDASKPVYGTCAGMILLAAEDGVGGGKKPQKGLNGVQGMNVWRNLYGNQLESFEAPLVIPALSKPTEPFPAIFIRAPAVHSLAPGNVKIQRLASLPDHLAASAPPSDTPLGPANLEDLKVVMLRQGRKLVTSFHPELSPDFRIHELFLGIVLEARA